MNEEANKLEKLYKNLESLKSAREQKSGFLEDKKIQNALTKKI